jgi:hypothetical protein
MMHHSSVVGLFSNYNYQIGKYSLVTRGISNELVYLPQVTTGTNGLSFSFWFNLMNAPSSYNSGLFCQVYTNNQQNGTGFVFYPGYQITTIVSIFSTTPVSTATVNNTNGISNVPAFSSYSTNWAFSLTGYFLPNSTGYWTFYLTADDVSVLYFGNNALNPSNNNYSVYNNYQQSVQPYKVYLTQGVYYPMLVYWGQSVSTQSFNLYFTDSNNVSYSGNGFFYNTGSVFSIPSNSYFTVNSSFLDFNVTSNDFITNDIRLDLSNNTIWGYVSNAGTNYYSQMVSSVPANSWNHFVWTLSLSGSMGVWNAYLNGANVYYSASQGYPTSVLKTNNTLMTNYSTSILGNMSDFRFYNNRVLNASEISNLYYNYTSVSNNSIINAPIWDTSLVSIFPFISNSDGYLTGLQISNTNYAVGTGSLYLNYNQFLSINETIVFDANYFSFSTWVYFPNVYPGSTIFTFSDGNSSTYANDYSLVIDLSGRQLLQIIVGGTNLTIHSTKILANNWYHIAVVATYPYLYNVYVNGVKNTTNFSRGLYLANQQISYSAYPPTNVNYIYNSLGAPCYDVSALILYYNFEEIVTVPGTNTIGIRNLVNNEIAPINNATLSNVNYVAGTQSVLFSNGGFSGSFICPYGSLSFSLWFYVNSFNAQTSGYPVLLSSLHLTLYTRYILLDLH